MTETSLGNCPKITFYGISGVVGEMSFYIKCTMFDKLIDELIVFLYS